MKFTSTSSTTESREKQFFLYRLLIVEQLKIYIFIFLIFVVSINKKLELKTKETTKNLLVAIILIMTPEGNITSS